MITWNLKRVGGWGGRRDETFLKLSVLETACICSIQQPKWLCVCERERKPSLLGYKNNTSNELSRRFSNYYRYAGKNLSLSLSPTLRPELLLDPKNQTSTPKRWQIRHRPAGMQGLCLAIREEGQGKKRCMSMLKVLKQVRKEKNRVLCHCKCGQMNSHYRQRWLRKQWKWDIDFKIESKTKLWCLLIGWMGESVWIHCTDKDKEQWDVILKQAEIEVQGNMFCMALLYIYTLSRIHL